jgi:DNA-binding MarR family transcriptional regulator
MTEPFDETIHAPNRLRICAFLDATTSTEFSVLRDLLGVADSVLSKHLKILQEAGHVEMTKPTGRGRVRTWVNLTPSGRQAYRNHVAALRALFDTPVPDHHRAERAGTPPTR